MNAPPHDFGFQTGLDQHRKHQVRDLGYPVPFPRSGFNGKSDLFQEPDMLPDRCPGNAEQPGQVLPGDGYLV